MPLGRLQMIHRVVPAAGVERIRIGQKGFAARVLDLVHNGAHVHRLDEGIRSALAEMQFNCRQIVFPDEGAESGGIEKPGDFTAAVVLRPACARTDTIDGAGHGIFPLWYPLQKNGVRSTATRSMAKKAEKDHSSDARSGKPDALRPTLPVLIFRPFRYDRSAHRRRDCRDFGRYRNHTRAFNTYARARGNPGQQATEGIA